MFCLWNYSVSISFLVPGNVKFFICFFLRFGRKCKTMSRDHRHLNVCCICQWKVVISNICLQRWLMTFDGDPLVCLHHAVMSHTTVKRLWDKHIYLYTVADLRGREGRPPGPKFSQFHAVFGKIWQNRMLVLPRELAPPPRGNPGSATAIYIYIYIYISHVHIYIYVYK